MFNITSLYGDAEFIRITVCADLYNWSLVGEIQSRHAAKTGLRSNFDDILQLFKLNSFSTTFGFQTRCCFALMCVVVGKVMKLAKVARMIASIITNVLSSVI